MDEAATSLLAAYPAPWLRAQLRKRLDDGALTDRDREGAKIQTIKDSVVSIHCKVIHNAIANSGMTSKEACDDHECERDNEKLRGKNSERRWW